MRNRNILLQPENERYFHWNGRCLDLCAGAPAEVVREWQAVGRRCRRRRRPLTWLRLRVFYAA